MTIKRINENTLSCIITPEDLHANGFKIDDFFERKKEAVDFIRSTVAQAAISENFDLAGELTTMRISVLPDHSLSLLITRETTKEGAADEVRKIAHSIFESIAARVRDKKAENDSDEAQGTPKEPSDDLMKALLSGGSPEESNDSESEGKADEPAFSPGNSFMFSFYSMRDAMDCCRVFSDAGPVESSLYYLQEDDTYFLIVRRTDRTPAGFEQKVLAANEFGELVTSQEQYIAFVTEHGICVAPEHAVEMFIDALPEKKVPESRTPGKARE